MRNTVSFITANFVAREVGWRLPEPFPQSWGVGDQATQACFKPIETYRERLATMLDAVQVMGFAAIDLWTAHLAPHWADEAHLHIAREELDRRGLRLVSLAGGMGQDRNHFDQICRLAVALGRPLLGGVAPIVGEQRHRVVEQLEAMDLRLAIENHAEKTPDELLARIGDGAGGRLGVAADTGWFGTQGYDAADALRILAPHLMHVHLKDVQAVGSHHTCAFGAGVVPIHHCVRTLREVGYTGPIGIEHEPHTHDPSDEIVQSFRELQQWMQQENAS